MSTDRAAFAGQLADLPVIELLRTIVHGRKTGTARFETSLGRATVWFREGEVIDADMGRFHMEDAVRRLIGVDQGTFEVEFKPITRRRLIKESTASLLETRPDDALPSVDGHLRARVRRPSKGWFPTGGGLGTPTNENSRMERPPQDPNEPAAPVSRRGTFSTSTNAVGPRLPPRPPTTGTSAPTPPPVPGPTTPGPRPPRQTVFGLPSPGSTGPHPVVQARDGVDERDRTVMRFPPQAPPSPPEPVVRPRSTDRVPINDGPRSPPPRALPRNEHRASQGPRVPLEEEPSGPISVGTTWQAPAPLATTTTTTTIIPGSQSIESDHRPTAGGVIASARSSDRMVLAFGTGPDRTAIETVSPEPAVTVDVFAPPTLPDAGRPDPAPQAWTYPTAFVPPTTALPGPRPNNKTLEMTPNPGPSPEALASARPDSTLVLPPEPRTAFDVPVARESPRESAALVPLAQAPAAAGPGAPAVVGRYEVLLRIARGGMGTVYLCRVTGEGGFRRLFALKVIRDHLSRNKEYVEMLLQEARIASRVHHPNVVGIIDIGVLSGQHYLVMDYVEGCTFSELLKVHHKVRPPQLIVPIVLDALTGLQAAHSLTDDDGTPLTLVHCDFSPQNMLVGTNGICMISDFGIAKAADALSEQPGITRGKPGYLSPEQALGRRIDHRSDIFSAGVVLWNALTGAQLFQGDTPEETIDQVLHRPIVPPSTVGLRPPSCFDAVCLKALERDPDRRFQSAQEMLIQLRRIAITEDLLAPSSDIARWVNDTFGPQLEARRQAAGISTKPALRGAAGLRHRSPQQVAIPELGLGTAEVATHALVRSVSETHHDDSSASSTMMLKGNLRASLGSDEDDLPRKRKALLIGSAAAMAVAVVLSAALHPEWFAGGYVDEYGSYVDMPATLGGEPESETPKKPKPGDGKTPKGDGKTPKGDGKAPRSDDETPQSDGKAPPAPDVGSVDGILPTPADALLTGATDPKPPRAPKTPKARTNEPPASSGSTPPPPPSPPPDGDRSRTTVPQFLPIPVAPPTPTVEDKP